jgi:hypothetical protein
MFKDKPTRELAFNSLEVTITKNERLKMHRFLVKVCVMNEILHDFSDFDLDVKLCCYIFKLMKGFIVQKPLENWTETFLNTISGVYEHREEMSDRHYLGLNNFLQSLRELVGEIHDMKGCPCRQICYVTQDRCHTESCTEPHDYLNFVFLACDTPLNASIVNVSRNSV